MAQLFIGGSILLRSAKAMHDVHALQPVKGLLLQFPHRTADVATSTSGRLSSGHNASVTAPRSACSTLFVVQGDVNRNSPLRLILPKTAWRLPTKVICATLFMNLHFVVSRSRGVI